MFSMQFFVLLAVEEPSTWLEVLLGVCCGVFYLSFATQMTAKLVWADLMLAAGLIGSCWKKSAARARTLLEKNTRREFWPETLFGSLMCWIPLFMIVGMFSLVPGGLAASFWPKEQVAFWVTLLVRWLFIAALVELTGAVIMGLLLLASFTVLRRTKAAE